MVLITYAAAVLAVATAQDTVRRPAADSTPAPVVRADTASPTSLAEAERRAAAGVRDTTPKRARPAILEYSAAYGWRATWHRRLSYPILPLFAAQYYFGEQLMDNQQGASSLTRNGHRVIATATAGIYTFNTVTGIWNMWEGRRDPSDRVRNWVHTALFAVSDAGFIYGATLAGDAQRYGQEYRDRHRTVELASMGISLVSWAMMFFWKD